MHKHFSLPRMSKLYCAAFVLIASFGLAAHADNIDDLVDTTMNAHQIPGMAVAVIKDNQVIKEQAYGYANLELKVPVTLDTSFALASMTKVFTASAIMTLVQDGKINLDDTITKYLPQLPTKWSNITVRQCLSHTSGLPDEITDDVNVTPVTGDRDHLFKLLAQKPLQARGVKSVYNQTGYTILGMMIEKVSGLRYEKYVEERLFQPAHMSNASFGDGWSVIPGRSDLYTALDITQDRSKLLMRTTGPVVMSDKIYHYGSKYMPAYMAPAGWANGSLHDLIQWEKLMAEGVVLSKSSMDQMMTPFKLKNGNDGEFGLAFLTMSFGGPFKAVSYGGGAATWRLSYPEKQLTVIVLTNLQGAQPQQIAAQIAALVEPTVADK